MCILGAVTLPTSGRRHTQRPSSWENCSGREEGREEGRRKEGEEGGREGGRKEGREEIMLYNLKFCLWTTEKNSLNNVLPSHESGLAIVSADKLWKSPAGVRYSLALAA